MAARVTNAGHRVWTAKDDARLRKLYPHKPTTEVAQLLKRSLSSTYQRALRHLGLRKTAAYLASPAACRLRRDASPRSIACRFSKGHVPANKGLRRPGWGPGRMKETQFKPGVRQGVAAKNWCPIGTIRTDSDGFIRIKVREAQPGEAYGFGNTGVWPLLNRHVWAQANGPIPPGHNIRFIDGNRKNCALDNLALISRAEMMRRNTIHNLPAPLKETVQLLGRLKRQIRKRERDASEKSDQRSA